MASNPWDGPPGTGDLKTSDWEAAPLEQAQGEGEWVLVGLTHGTLGKAWRHY